jgi:hypothetical protein
MRDEKETKVWIEEGIEGRPKRGIEKKREGRKEERDVFREMGGRARCGEKNKGRDRRRGRWKDREAIDEVIRYFLFCGIFRSMKNR